MKKSKKLSINNAKISYEAKFKISSFFSPKYRTHAFTLKRGVNGLNIYFVAICYYYIRAPHKIELSLRCKFNIRDSLIGFRLSLLHLLGNHTKCSHCQNGLERNIRSLRFMIRTISLFSCINTIFGEHVFGRFSCTRNSSNICSYSR